MKKILLVYLIIITSQAFAFAQWSQSMFNSPNQQLVEDAVRKGIVLVRQDYQLQDTLTNQKYGRNHETYFGTVYSIAAKLQNALSVSERFVSPWEYDSNFAQYNNSHYQPIISKTMFRALSDSSYTELHYNRNYIRALEEGIVYHVDSLSHPDRGFIVDRSIGEKEGWLVWVFASDTTQLSNESLSLVTYKHKVTLEEGLNKYMVTQPGVSGHILGGIYVCPNITVIGTVDFLFEGLIVHDVNEQWQFYVFCETESGSTTLSDNLPEQGDELTPVTENTQNENNSRHRSRNRSHRGAR